jgi:nitrogen regulatory protein PII
MKKLETVLKPAQVADCVSQLDALGVRRVLMSQAVMHTPTAFQTHVYRGGSYSRDAELVRLECVVSDFQLDEVTETLARIVAPSVPDVLIFDVMNRRYAAVSV